MEILSSKKIRDLMIEKAMGVNQLAALAEMTPATISKLLKADSPCRLPTISKLAKALNIPAKVLMATD